jgi:PAS domain S-box-containing protein
MQKRMLWGTLLLTLLAGGLTWWMLRRQLAPMLHTAQTLSLLATGDLHVKALPVTHQDEIGNMIGGFNHLLETLVEREMALAESEYRWKFAVEGAGDGLWDWNVPQGTVIFSSRCNEMRGFTQADIGADVDGLGKRVHPDDLERVMVDVQAHLDGQTTHYRNEHRVSCKDGSWKWILDRGLVVSRDATGKPLRVIGTYSDITETKRMERELRVRNIELEAAKAVAEEANLAKSNFLASMSHELRTPLNSILGYAQLIETGATPLTPIQERNLDQVLKGGWYLLELINGVLDFAQIESGMLTLSLESTSLDEILHDCQALIEPLAKQRTIDMTFAHPENCPVALADHIRVKQCLLNLLSNAIKYNTTHGSVGVACVLNMPNSVRISVRDTGMGMTPKQIGHLFQPFNRLGREAGVEAGAGIGLVVTKRLVEMMGGTIGVESSVGTGSVFWINLPLATA